MTNNNKSGNSGVMYDFKAQIIAYTCMNNFKEIEINII